MHSTYKIWQYEGDACGTIVFRVSRILGSQPRKHQLPTRCASQKVEDQVESIAHVCPPSLSPNLRSELAISEGLSKSTGWSEKDKKLREHFYWLNHYIPASGVKRRNPFSPCQQRQCNHPLRLLRLLHRDRIRRTSLAIATRSLTRLGIRSCRT